MSMPATDAKLAKLIQQGLDAYSRGEYAREVALWKQVSALEPQNPHWQANLAHALANAGELDQAEILFHHAMSATPPPSAAFNNYARLCIERGAELTSLLPLFIVSLEASETYEHFQRHLLNLSASIALADREIPDGAWDHIQERALNFLERKKDRTPAHEEFVSTCVRLYGNYEPFKQALIRQDWVAAHSCLDSLAREFGIWPHGGVEVSRIQHYRPLLTGAAHLFSLLTKLGSDAEYDAKALYGDVDKSYAALRRVGERAYVLGNGTFLDILGWSVAELHRQATWLVQPCGDYDAEAHATPSAYLLALTDTAYAELGEMLQALLIAFNRIVRRASQRLSTARSEVERSEVLARAWRAIRTTAHGVVGEYQGLSECLTREMLGWNKTPRDRLSVDVQRFKSFVEARVHPDLYVHGKPQEQVGRAILLAFLRDRGFSEVPVRGGRVDILVVHRESTFVIELKIWRGPQYHEDGILELSEYIAEQALPQFGGATYIVLDPTESCKAGEYASSHPALEGIDVVVVTINPGAPSRQGARKRRHRKRR